MRRPIVLFGLIVAVLALTLGGYTVAQDQAGTPSADGTPCASPSAGTPAVTPDAAATPDAADPCATPGTGTAATAVDVEMVDIAFTQKELTIPANTDVTFHFTNNGTTTHDFKIDDPEVFSGEVGSGQTADLVVNLPPGTYEYYCTIPGHKQAGMVGTLTVQ